MDLTMIGIIGIIVLIVLIISGLHVGLVLTFVGGLGTIMILGPKGGLNLIGSTPFSFASAYNLSPVPLFLLMGAFAEHGDLGKITYDTMNKWIGRIRGGLAIASIFGSAFFGLVCGSSLAATGIFVKMALPEMLKRKYDKSFAIGSIASAGTFSTMIPPSGLLILYAIFTEASIGRLFMAGLLPGIITAIIYATFIYFRVWINPSLAPRASERYSWAEKTTAILRVWPIFILATLILGGIFKGWFTATEAGGIGAFGTLIIVIINKGIKGANIADSLIGSMRTTGMIFLIAIGAIIFGRFLSLTQIPVLLADFLVGLAVPRFIILIGMLVLFFFLGMLLDMVAILAITMPVLFPVVIHLGFDPIWFGIIAVKIGEIGLVTPPVGLNVYVAVAASDGKITLLDAFKGITPFISCDIIVLGLLVAFPKIALLLPNFMFSN